MIEFVQTWEGGLFLGKEERLAEVFKALAHPTRVKIVEYLADGEKCVKDIWQELGVPQPTVSQHINILKTAGIISFRKEGVKTCYRIEKPVVVKILKLLEEEVDNG